MDQPPSSNKTDFVGISLISLLLILLLYAGWLSYKSIDWTVLKRLESQQLILPTPIPATSSAQTASPSSAPRQ